MGRSINKNCINILWRNGFGNQLFQYSYGRILAEEKGWELTHSGNGRGCASNLLEYKFIQEPQDIKKIDSTHKIQLLIDYNKTQAVELENPQNYLNYLDKINSFFPVEPLKRDSSELVVHLRLGDNGSNVYTPFEWYKKAIEDNKINFTKIFLVTDEPQSKDALKFKEYYNANIFSSVTIKSTNDRAKYPHQTLNDFNFIRQFNKILFSNSTFAWWAAVLSKANEVYFNKEWQPNHYNGMIKLGETNYKNFKGICPFSLKEVIS